MSPVHVCYTRHGPVKKLVLLNLPRSSYTQRGTEAVQRSDHFFPTRHSSPLQEVRNWEGRKHFERISYKVHETLHFKYQRICVCLSYEYIFVVEKYKVHNALLILCSSTGIWSTLAEGLSHMGSHYVQKLGALGCSSSHLTPAFISFLVHMCKKWLKHHLG